MTMLGAYFPGNRTVELREVAVPEPGVGQVLLQTRASGICGSDLEVAYRQHKNRGSRTYANVVGGHEPAGEIAAVGPGCKRFAVGDRVLLYHRAGCGSCLECRRGYLIMCEAPTSTAYGVGRDGGHAPYLLAEEHTCVPIPAQLSYVDGALIACGFGTAYESLLRLGLSGADRMLVVGLGPVGAATAMVAQLFGAQRIVGVEPSEGRRVWADSLGLFGDVATPDALGDRDFDVVVDCSGSTPGRRLALERLARWGRCGLIGEGNRLDVDVSDLILHKQATITGSWVTSLSNMETLAARFAATDLRPERLVSHRYRLDDISAAYQRVDQGGSGKVCIVFD